MIWREVSAQFRVLAQHLYRGDEKNYKEGQDSRRPDWAANQEPPPLSPHDYKSEALQAEPKWPMKRAREMEKAESKGAHKKQKTEIPGNAFSLILPKVHPGLRI